jgi:hypothetical protein
MRIMLYNLRDNGFDEMEFYVEDESRSCCVLGRGAQVDCKYENSQNIPDKDWL